MFSISLLVFKRKSEIIINKNKKDFLKKNFRFIVQIRDKIDRFIFGKLVNPLISELSVFIDSDIDTILDLGCGSNSPLRHFKNKLSRLVGADLFIPSLNSSRASKLHHEYFQIDVLSSIDYFEENSFDCVALIDVIEHLKKSDGLKLIKQMETIARKKIIVFTPNGFLEQKPFDGNEYQRHISGWEVEEMQQMGFKVIGINGYKPLRGERANIIFWPTIFWKRISYLSQLIVKNKPRYAFQILCVKNL